MAKLFRFIYLNTYAFLLLFAGTLVLALPFWLLSPFTLIIQFILALPLFICSLHLFSGWDDKKREYKILMAKNKDVIRPESFKIFMEAPCGRKLTHVVLKDLGKESEYKNLLIYKPKLIDELKAACKKPEHHVLYVNDTLINEINSKK